MYFVFLYKATTMSAKSLAVPVSQEIHSVFFVSYSNSLLVFSSAPPNLHPPRKARPRQHVRRHGMGAYLAVKPNPLASSDSKVNP